METNDNSMGKEKICIRLVRAIVNAHPGKELTPQEVIRYMFDMPVRTNPGVMSRRLLIPTTREIANALKTLGMERVRIEREGQQVTRFYRVKPIEPVEVVV
jgi:hypothetical protein